MSNVRPIPESYYYSGQGRLLMGTRDPATGQPVGMFAVGNVPALEIQIAVTKVDHKESMTGQRSIDLTLVTEKTPTFNITFESLSLQNLVAAFWGEQATVTGGTVTAEPVMLVRGQPVALKNPGVTDLVITIPPVGAGQATPVPELGNYDVDPAFGTIYPLADAEDIPADTGVLASAAYTFSDHGRLDALMATQPPERYLRFEGLNTVDGSFVLVEIPRASFEPLQSLPLINDDIAQVQVTGSILLDTKIVSGSPYYIEKRIAADWETAETP